MRRHERGGGRRQGCNLVNAFPCMEVAALTWDGTSWLHEAGRGVLAFGVLKQREHCHGHGSRNRHFRLLLGDTASVHDADAVHDASRPSEDAVKLMCYFIGTTDGSPAMLGEQKVDVKFDEKGGFKTEVASPSEKLVRTTKTTTSGGGHRRGRRRGGGGSVKTTSETSGSRVTGCIIQLMVNGKVEKAYASNPGWSRLAKTNPLPESEVLKIR